MGYRRKKTDKPGPQPGRPDMDDPDLNDAEAKQKAKRGSRKWEPNAETRTAMMATWRPVQPKEIHETPEMVIERNMQLNAVLGNRTLETAHQRLHAGEDWRNVEFLFLLGMSYRDRAEKSAKELLPYHKGKMGPVPAREEAEVTDHGTQLELDGTDPVGLEIAEAFKTAKPR